MNTLVLITAPEEPVISLEQAKKHAVLEADDDDELIDGILHAVMGEVDGRDGMMGRALVTQTWELRLDRFPASFTIPLPPLQSVTSIVYVDTDGTEQTLAADQYTVLSGREPAIIEPAYGVCWPVTRCQRDAVRVRFVAGYGAAKDVPELIKHYMKIRIATLYEHREAFIVGTIIAPTPGIAHMLDNLRIR